MVKPGYNIPLSLYYKEIKYIICSAGVNLTQKRSFGEGFGEISPKRPKSLLEELLEESSLEESKGVKVFNHMCEFCQKTFWDLSNLRIHRESVHLKIKAR